MLNLLQITEVALKASPFNAYAYGLLVAVLVSAVVALWLRLQYEQKERAKLIEKTTELMTKFLISFGEDKNLREVVRDGMFEIKTFASQYLNKSGGFERKIDEILSHLKSNK